MNKRCAVVVAASAVVFSQAVAAQVYRPDAFGTTNHTQQLEAEALRMEAFRASRDPVRARNEGKPEPLTFYGRLGNYAAENPGDGFTFRRATGPKVGNVSVGLRRKF